MGVESGFNPRNKVAYRVYGRQIIFTGLHNGSDGGRGSTINFEEEIILAISKAESINPSEYEFYDLQTQQSYGGLWGDHKPGDYTFNKVCFEYEEGKMTRKTGWEEGYCDPKVLEDWMDYIWGNYPRGTVRNLPVAWGSLLPMPREQEHQVCLFYRHPKQ